MILLDACVGRDDTMCTKYLLLDPRYEPIGDSIPKVGKHRCTDISRSISNASKHSIFTKVSLGHYLC